MRCLCDLNLEINASAPSPPKKSFNKICRLRLLLKKKKKIGPSTKSGLGTGPDPVLIGRQTSMLTHWFGAITFFDEKDRKWIEEALQTSFGGKWNGGVKGEWNTHPCMYIRAYLCTYVHVALCDCFRMMNGPTSQNWTKITGSRFYKYTVNRSCICSFIFRQSAVVVQRQEASS
jgi:hypothetical protein